MAVSLGILECCVFSAVESLREIFHLMQDVKNVKHQLPVEQLNAINRVHFTTINLQTDIKSHPLGLIMWNWPFAFSGE